MNILDEDTIKNLSIKEIETLRNQMSKKLLDMKREKMLRVTIYIQGQFRDSYEIAKAWAFENKLIAKDSNWAFAKFSISNTIKMIFDEIERERNAPPTALDKKTNPDEPNTT